MIEAAGAAPLNIPAGEAVTSGNAGRVRAVGCDAAAMSHHLGSAGTACGSKLVSSASIVAWLYSTPYVVLPVSVKPGSVGGPASLPCGVRVWSQRKRSLVLPAVVRKSGW